MWQTRYDAVLDVLPLVFSLVKIDCCVDSCDFNSSNFYFLNSLCTGKSFVYLRIVRDCEMPFKVPLLRKRDASIMMVHHGR